MIEKKNCNTRKIIPHLLQKSIFFNIHIFPLHFWPVVQHVVDRKPRFYFILFFSKEQALRDQKSIVSPKNKSMFFFAPRSTGWMKNFTKVYKESLVLERPTFCKKFSQYFFFPCCRSQRKGESTDMVLLLLTLSLILLLLFQLFSFISLFTITISFYDYYSYLYYYYFYHYYHYHSNFLFFNHYRFYLHYYYYCLIIIIIMVIIKKKKSETRLPWNMTL